MIAYAQQELINQHFQGFCPCQAYFPSDPRIKEAKRRLSLQLLFPDALAWEPDTKPRRLHKVVALIKLLPVERERHWSPFQPFYPANLTKILPKAVPPQALTTPSLYAQLEQEAAFVLQEHRALTPTANTGEGCAVN